MIYFIRTITALAILVWIALTVIKGSLADLQGYALLEAVGRLDPLRALFHSLLLPAFIFLFLPLGLLPNKPKSRALTAKLIGTATAIFGYAYFLNTRIGLHPDSWFAAAWIAMGVNIAGFAIVAHAPESGSKKVRLFFQKAFLISDLIFPGIVWAFHKPSNRWLHQLYRPMIATIACLPVAITGFQISMDTKGRLNLPPEITIVDKGSSGSGFYYSSFDDQGYLYALDGHHLLKKYSKDLKKIIAQFPIQDPGSQYFMLNAKQDKLAISVQHKEHTRWIELSTKDLRPIFNREYTQKSCLHDGATHNLWDENRKISISITEGGNTALSAEKDLISYVQSANAAFTALDPKRNRFYITHLNIGQITAHDARTLEVVAHLFVPRYGERMVLDAKNDRLLVTFPMEGVIREIHLTDFSLGQTYRSFFGVRAIGLNEEKRILFLGGLSPFLEIRNADTFELMDRFIAPYWQRSITSESSDQAIISGVSGLYFLGFKGSQANNLKRFLRIHDPFFTLMNISYPIINRIHPIDLTKGSKKTLPSAPMQITPMEKAN